MFILNKQQFLNSVTKRNKKIDTIAKEESLEIFREKRDDAMDKFDNHEITAELEKDGEDDDAPEIMGGRSGNLRAVIGFDSTETPAQDLKDFLFDNIRMSFYGAPSKKKDGWLYRFEVFKPSLQEIYSAFPYPDGHTGGSWVRGIEQGIPRLNYYLFSTKKQFKNSRSGNAIQSKNIVRESPERTSGVKYVSEILSLFK